LAIGRSVAATPRGEVLLDVSCPATASGGCHGKITLLLDEGSAHHARARAARCARGCRALGNTNYQARAGQTKRVRVHMASYGRKLLAQRKSLRVTLIATSVSGSQTTSTEVKITLRAGARHA
jgi:hypothetical protein